VSIAAYAALAAKQPLSPYVYEPSPLLDTEVEVEISHCGICHSDLHLIDNDWRTSSYPLVPGHEVVGIVGQAGAQSGLAAGERVGIGWQRSACLECDVCRGGDENLCPRQQATCVGHMGGFAQRLRIDGRFAFPLPKRLESASAAPLLCAGVTVFAPLRRWKVGRGSRVGLIGMGGLGHLAVRFLKAMGCETIVFTSTPAKREDAMRLGAQGTASSTNAGELRPFKEHFDFLLCTAPARLDWISYLQMLKPNGVLCLVGAPPGLMQIPAALLLTGQRTICGSDIGSPRDIRDMLTFAEDSGIAAEVETAPMTDANRAIDRVRKNEVRYRMVLTN
jgi:uncharacterized zinc-type alcohol dehydrogenase-like protein